MHDQDERCKVQHGVAQSKDLQESRTIDDVVQQLVAQDTGISDWREASDPLRSR